MKLFKGLTPVVTAISLLVALSAWLPGAKAAGQPSSAPIGREFFGMHMHRAATSTPWPEVPFGSWRLWDAYVAWPYLEPTKGQWHFEALDRLVSLAEQNDVEVLLPLGLTPAWASARPGESSSYKKPGWAAEPRSIEDWRNYVRAVATRYKGRIRHYEIWNEPNLKGFFSGSVDQMLLLTREASLIIKQVDPAAVIVSPAATGEGDGVKWLDQFLAKGGGRYVDVIGYHFYVTPKPPEAMLPLINQVRGVMTRNNCGGKPLWNTEAGWDQKKRFSDAEAAAYLVRSYLVNWAGGVSRFYWYAWDSRNWSGLDLTRSDDRSLTPAATAYAELEKWLTGKRMLSCASNDQGVWICEIEGSGYKGHILWSPERTGRFQVPRSWGAHQARELTGSAKLLAGGAALDLGPVPLLVD